MKFDLTKWQECDVNEWVDAPTLGIRLNLSLPCALWARSFGVVGPRLIGFGSSFDVDLIGCETAQFLVEGSAKAKAFVFVPDSVGRAARVGAFTNPDRADQASGPYAAILADLRQMKLQQAEDRAGFRADARLREHRLAAKMKLAESRQSSSSVVDPDGSPPDA